jgi:CrcB protein
LWDYVWIGLGTAIGGVARYWCSGVVARRFGEHFPWGTLVVNVGGSFVIGAFGGLSGAEGRFFVDPAVRQFVMVGICGGFTTFSSFSLQTLNLARDGEWLRVMGNIVLSVLACLLSVWLGDAAARALLGTMMEGA